MPSLILLLNKYNGNRDVTSYLTLAPFRHQSNENTLKTTTIKTSFRINHCVSSQLLHQCKIRFHTIICKDNLITFEARPLWFWSHMLCLVPFFRSVIWIWIKVSFFYWYSPIVLRKGETRKKFRLNRWHRNRWYTIEFLIETHPSS